jgi:hypothetical protein
VAALVQELHLLGDQISFQNLGLPLALELVFLVSLRYLGFLDALKHIDPAVTVCSQVLFNQFFRWVPS